MKVKFSISLLEITFIFAFQSVYKSYSAATVGTVVRLIRENKFVLLSLFLIIKKTKQDLSFKIRDGL
jgi:hypothetical protein